MSKHTDKKVRTDWVYGTVNVGHDGILTLNHDLATDALEIVDAVPGSTRTERSYKKDSGKPKIISSIPSNGASAFGATKALLAFDWVIAVDTNTRNVDGVVHSICVSYYVPKPPVSYENGQIPFILLRAYLISGVAHGVNPERIGWHLILANHIRLGSLGSQRLAIVVDSELGLHAGMNSRDIGYYADNLLPSNTLLVYASDSDRGTLQGAMIQMCHDTADRIFEAFRKDGGIPVIPRNSLDPNFEAFSLIRSPKN